jgi:hypothetical protein
MLVVSSINPYARQNFQLKCYKKWKILGYRYLTLNSADEAAELLKIGIDKADIYIISDEQTAQKNHGFKSPRIKPVLDILIHKIPFDFLILTNSDIFPNARKRMDIMSNVFTCAAFTRREIFSIELCDFGSVKQYRGGLDIFFFSKSALNKLWFHIKNDQLSDRMAFGVPGWDFYLGGFILSEALQGKILDGTVFCHESHLTTYRHVKEFEYYLEGMKLLGVCKSDLYQTAVAEFASRIEKECILNYKLSKFLYVFYHDNTKKADDTFDLTEINLDIDDLIKANIFYKPSDARFLVEKALFRKINLSAFLVYFCRSPSIEIKFGQYLACLYFLLTLKYRTGMLSLSTKYPVGNCHRLAIDNAMELTNQLEARYYLMDICCSEIIEHGIFNKNLLKAIALNCINDRERWFIAEILKIIRDYKNAQAA